METTYKIIQTSYPGTGSTLLINLLHGFFIPTHPYYCPPKNFMCDLLKNNLIINYVVVLYKG